MPGQFAPTPKNPTPRRVGSRVSPAGRLSDPRQIVARTMYKIPPRTSRAPNPISTILASTIHRCYAQRVRIQAPGGVIRSGHLKGVSPRRSNDPCDRKAVSGHLFSSQLLLEALATKFVENPSNLN